MELDFTSYFPHLALYCFICINQKTALRRSLFFCAVAPLSDTEEGCHSATFKTCTHNGHHLLVDGMAIEKLYTKSIPQTVGFVKIFGVNRSD